MNALELHEYILKYGAGIWNHLKFKHRDLVEKIKHFDGDSLSERVYNYTHQDQNNKCIVCGNKARFVNYNKGYTPYCNKKCYEKVHGQKIKDAKERGCYQNAGIKAKETFLQNGGSYEERQKKYEATMLQRHGVINPGQLPDIAEKRKKSNKEKFGTEKNLLLSEATKRRTKNKEIGFGSEKFKAFLEKHGVENTSQLPEVKKIKSKKNLDRIVDNLLSGNRLKGVVEPLFTREEYFGTRKKKYEFKCCKCNFIFEDTLRNGKIPRCTKCYPLYLEKSYAQKEIYEFIKSLGFECLYNDRKTLGGLELDIYVPTKQVAIEYNGLHWHSELGGKKDKFYHLNKFNECKKRNIRLIQIFSDEWIENENLIKNRLIQILGKNDTNINAGQCEIKEINSVDKEKFLDNHHIQGNDKSKIKVGAYYNNELIAIMTFGGYRNALGQIKRDGEYELMRFCTSKKSSGIASRLLIYFITKYSPKKIISYADKRWSDGKLYEMIGFQKVSDATPNYWYLDKKNNRIHRYVFRKQILSKILEKFDPNLTEWQNMQLNGYDRIWDCGSLKYQLIL